MHKTNEVYIKDLWTPLEGSKEADWAKSKEIEKVITEGIAKKLDIPFTELSFSKDRDCSYDSAIKGVRIEVKAVSRWNTITAELKPLGSFPGGLDFSETTYHIFLTPGMWGERLLLKLQAIETGRLRQYLREKPELFTIEKKGSIRLASTNIKLKQEISKHVTFLGYFNILSKYPVSFDISSLVLLNDVHNLRFS